LAAAPDLHALHVLHALCGRIRHRKHYNGREGIEPNLRLQFAG
jgi:hypothetical protein